MQLEKYKIDFEKNKELIIHLWLNLPQIKEIFYNQKDLSRELFKEYTNLLFEHYFDNLENQKKEFSDEFTKYFNVLKKLKVEEVFSLHNGFKKALYDFSSKQNIKTLLLFEEIELSCEVLFEKVLNSYSKTEENNKVKLNKPIDIVDKYVILSKTDKNGILTDVSSAFCEMTGYESYELIGKPHNKIRHPNMPKEFYEDLWRTISSGLVWSGNIKNQKKNGDYYWVKTTIHPNFDSQGKIVGYDAVMVDITAAVYFEEQETFLIEQSKLAAMGEMISMIAHQWRQPLQTVSLLVQKLTLSRMLNENITNESIDKVVKQIVTQLNYMSKTIDDFRDYFKPNKEKEKVFIEDVVKKSINFLDYLFKINLIKVEYKNSSYSQVAIFLNETVQVLINLFKNACDAMIANEIENRVINVTTFEEDNYLVIEIEDNAGGIPDEIINRIFEPYFSTKNEKNGTGLGLYMTRTIIQQHSKGNVFVKNTENGTKFIVQLPLK